MKKTILLAFAGLLATVSSAPADSLLQKATRGWVPDGYRDLLEVLPEPSPNRKMMPGGHLAFEGTPKALGAGTPGNHLGIHRGIGDNGGTEWKPAHGDFAGSGAPLDKGCGPARLGQWPCN